MYDHLVSDPGVHMFLEQFQRKIAKVTHGWVISKAVQVYMTLGLSQSFGEALTGKITVRLG